MQIADYVGSLGVFTIALPQLIINLFQQMSPLRAFARGQRDSAAVGRNSLSQYGLSTLILY
mgnify:CR=1 FL=1